MKFGKKLLTGILATATILSPLGAIRTEAAPQMKTPETITVPASEDGDDTYMGSAEEAIADIVAKKAENQARTAARAGGSSIAMKSAWVGDTVAGAPRDASAPQYMGIDVSKWQNSPKKDPTTGETTYTAIDWTAVKASGVKFAIIKVGGRTITGGALYADPCFEMNIRGAIAAGIPVGVYFYCGSINPTEAVEDANWVLGMVKSYPLSLPVFYDYEYQNKVSYPYERVRDDGGEEAVRSATIDFFCKTVEAGGRRAGFYTGSNLAKGGTIDYTTLSSRYVSWIARYGKNDATIDMAYFPAVQNVDIWQYSSYGNVGGISGRVDMDLWFDSGNANVADVPVYRVYNHSTGEHLYTTNAAERDLLAASGSWVYEEGGGWTSPGFSAYPVYRLYNPHGVEHFYTKSAEEKDMLVKAGWNYEGIAFYSADPSTGLPLYRCYNKNARANNHHYTPVKAEADWLVTMGWRYEGISFYAKDPNAAYSLPDNEGDNSDQTDSENTGETDSTGEVITGDDGSSAAETSDAGAEDAAGTVSDGALSAD